MASFQRFHCLPEDLACGIHNLREHVLKVALCNIQPDIAMDAVLDDVGEIDPGNGYDPGGSIALQVPDAKSPLGTFELFLSPVMWRATGPIGPFQWAVLYNASAQMNARGRKGHPLIAAWAYRREIDLDDGESYVWRAKEGRPVLRFGG